MHAHAYCEKTLFWSECKILLVVITSPVKKKSLEMRDVAVIQEMKFLSNTDRKIFFFQFQYGSLWIHLGPILRSGKLLRGHLPREKNTLLTLVFLGLKLHGLNKNISSNTRSPRHYNQLFGYNHNRLGFSLRLIMCASIAELTLLCPWG